MFNDFSASNLITFLDYAVEKGILNINTAISRKVEVQRILAVLDESERSDLSRIVTDDVFRRFTNNFGTDVKPGTLTSYLIRFTKARDDFLNWARGSAPYEPASAQGARRATSVSNCATKKRKEFNKDGETTSSVPSNAPRKHLYPVVFPIRIRPGVVVHIYDLPLDLTSDEAKKLGNVIAVLATS